MNRLLRVEGIGAYMNSLWGVSFSGSSIGELGLTDEISEVSLGAIMERGWDCAWVAVIHE